MNLLRKASILAGTTRPPFLILSTICAFSGFAAVYHEGTPVNYLYLFLIFTGALAAHISVNVINEYFDFRSGLDLHTMRTPFSGGSGTLPHYPELHKAAGVLGIVSVLTVVTIGIYFLILRGPVLLIALIPGLVSMIFYSPFFVKRPLLCLFSPGVGFGFSIVTGTSIALSGSLSATANIISLIPFFLVNNLLLLNQYPDIDIDRKFKRNNILIAYGTDTGVFIYDLFTVCAIAVIIVAIYFKIFPLLAVAGIIPAMYALKGMINFKNEYTDNARLVRQLKINVMAVLVTPLLVSLSLCIK